MTVLYIQVLFKRVRALQQTRDRLIARLLQLIAEGNLVYAFFKDNLHKTVDKRKKDYKRNFVFNHFICLIG